MAKCIIFHYHGGSFVGIIRVPIGEFLSLKALGVWEWITNADALELTDYAAHSQSVPPYLRLLQSNTAICRREDKAQYRDIHLSACASYLMSGAGSLIYPATQSRKTCMRFMKQQTALTGRSLRNAISRNFKKAGRRGSALRRGNLSLPCPNHSLVFMSQTSCFSQTASKKNMAWSAYQRCTIISERQITISILFFRNGNCCPNP